jgi:hypothetical protein
MAIDFNEARLIIEAARKRGIIRAPGDQNTIPAILTAGGKSPALSVWSVAIDSGATWVGAPFFKLGLDGPSYRRWYKRIGNLGKLFAPARPCNLSDRCGAPLRFTGAMFGIHARDLGGTRAIAGFD